jgi:ketosteroid isomerase-like protein
MPLLFSSKPSAPMSASLRVCWSRIMATRDNVGTALLDDFGMNIRSLFVCGTLLLFASAAFAGSYQRTRDGQTLVWRDVPSRGDEATWSGKRDKDGFATGSGVLTWYKAKPTIVTGSHILGTGRDVTRINHYSGTMVRGKFKGAVTYVDRNGKRLQATSDTGTNRRSRRQKVTRAPTPRVRATPMAEQTPTPSSQPIIIDNPEGTSALAAPTSAQEQSPSPIAQEPQAAVPPETATPATEQMAAPPESTPEESPSPIAQQPQTAVPPQIVSLASKRMATPPAEQQLTQPNDRSTTVPPFELPKPARHIDEQTVARLDTLYQSAVKANDVATMDEILADDFILLTERGASLTKADLIKEAQEKRTIYEEQELEEGTQKVRIWRDTAVVTALLRIKGTRDQNPFDYKVSLSETYVRTPTGWRYVFGQASKAEGE